MNLKEIEYIVKIAEERNVHQGKDKSFSSLPLRPLKLANAAT